MSYLGLIRISKSSTNEARLCGSVFVSVLNQVTAGKMDFALGDNKKDNKMTLMKPTIRFCKCYSHTLGQKIEK